jgi:hypothetical protein
MTTPCAECPFLKPHVSGLPCHKASDLKDGQYIEKPDDATPHCAGALIYLEKRNAPHQMMRIAERLGLYDRTKLDMTAEVR